MFNTRFIRLQTLAENRMRQERSEYARERRTALHKWDQLNNEWTVPNTKGQTHERFKKNAYLLWYRHTIGKFSGWSPSSSDKTTRRTTIKRLKTMKNEMSHLLFGWAVVQCLAEPGRKQNPTQSTRPVHSTRTAAPTCVVRSVLSQLSILFSNSTLYGEKQMLWVMTIWSSSSWMVSSDVFWMKVPVFL